MSFRSANISSRIRVFSSPETFYGRGVGQIGTRRTDKRIAQSERTFVRCQSGLTFSNVKANEVQRISMSTPRRKFAQAGAVASADISLLAGQFPAELHLHGAMEPQLRNLGMPTRLENGAIELLEEFTVCKTGDQLSSDQARILKQFGHRLANSASVCSLGAIELLEEFTVCKKGDQLYSDQARILKQFGHRLAQFRVRLLAR
ncbi:hypothetical protein niasHS_008610 [Heterodera schachtii]|uniref:Large ribosomal subunit protein uL10-like insertion domain-containing protein n=1 Tax=Heterodera schachtii TaxID=97005 RepID=A0ABD2IXU6_HETSC